MGPQGALCTTERGSLIEPLEALCEKRGPLLLKPRVLSVRTAARLSVTTGDLSARFVCSLGSFRDGSDAAAPRRPSMTYLWIQDEVRSRRLQVRRVKSEDNIADLGTKPLSRAVIAKHCTTMGYMNMSQEDAQMGHQSWGCFKTLNQCEAGDHVQRTSSEQQQQKQQQQEASHELPSSEKSGSQSKTMKRIRGLDGARDRARLGEVDNGLLQGERRGRET